MQKNILIFNTKFLDIVYIRGRATEVFSAAAFWIKFENEILYLTSPSPHNYWRLKMVVPVGQLPKEVKSTLAIIQRLQNKL